MEFLANGEGALPLPGFDPERRRRGGEDLGDSPSALDAFQQSVIDALEGRVSE